MASSPSPSSSSSTTSISPTVVFASNAESGGSTNSNSNNGTAAPPLPRTYSISSISSGSSGTATGASSSSSLQQRLAQTISPFPNVPPRRPETQNLAVLLPKSYWKSDRDASKCDISLCRKPFSFLWGERRHHCRRCGGIFCQECSSQHTALLDISRLVSSSSSSSSSSKSLSASLSDSFTPLESLISPKSPMLLCRVCDNCYEQLHGTIPPRQRDLRAIAAKKYPLPPRPLNDRYKPKESLIGKPRPPPEPAPRYVPRSPKDDPDSLENLFPYPLRVPSAECKKQKLALFVARPVPPRYYDSIPIPGVEKKKKKLFEVEYEREMEEEREREDDYWGLNHRIELERERSMEERETWWRKREERERKRREEEERKKMMEMDGVISPLSSSGSSSSSTSMA